MHLLPHRYNVLFDPLPLFQYRFISAIKKTADKLFSPFLRLRNKEDYPWTGVGLASVKRIIQRHDGEIQVSSKPGKGATFSFTVAETQHIL